MSEPYWEPLAAAPNTTIIAEVILGSAGNFDIQNIPQTYRALQLELSLRSTAAAGQDAVVTRFNNDSATIYSRHQVSINGTTTTPYIFQGLTDPAFYSLACPGATTELGFFNAAVLWIPGYRDSVYKQFTFLNNHWDGSILNTTWGGGWYKASTGINRIQINPITGGATFAAGSRVTVTGL